MRIVCSTQVRVESWFDHEAGGPYDAITAIEVIEHCAGNTMWRTQRVARYRRFFRRCHSWLRPAGRLSVQANAWNERGWLASLVLPPQQLAPARSGGTREGLGLKDILGGVKNVREGLPASRKVYPECFLPTRGELIEASRGLFGVVEERSDPKARCPTSSGSRKPPSDSCARAASPSSAWSSRSCEATARQEWTPEARPPPAPYSARPGPSRRGSRPWTRRSPCGPERRCSGRDGRQEAGAGRAGDERDAVVVLGRHERRHMEAIDEPRHVGTEGALHQRGAQPLCGFG